LKATLDKFLLKDAFPESNKIVLLYSFNFIITASDTSGQPLFQQYSLLLDICHLCLKLHLRQYQAKDNLHFLLSCNSRTFIVLISYSIFISVWTPNAAKPNTSGQASSLSATPSPSVSGQPFNAAKPNTSGQASALSWIPSPSVSGQPLNSFKPATSGHASLSYIPSPSVSFPPNLKVRPAVC
jgi:hypothetical protein